MGLFTNTVGIGSGLIGCLNAKFDAFPQTRPYLKPTVHFNKFATRGYL